MIASGALPAIGRLLESGKRDLKKVELIGELKSYGAFAGDIPAVADVSITDIRKQISEAKKAKKVKSTKKAKKTKMRRKSYRFVWGILRNF